MGALALLCVLGKQELEQLALTISAVALLHRENAAAASTPDLFRVCGGEARETASAGSVGRAGRVKGPSRRALWLQYVQHCCWRARVAKRQRESTKRVHDARAAAATCLAHAEAGGRERVKERPVSSSWTRCRAAPPGASARARKSTHGSQQRGKKKSSRTAFPSATLPRRRRGQSQAPRPARPAPSPSRRPLTERDQLAARDLLRHERAATPTRAGAAGHDSARDHRRRLHIHDLRLRLPRLRGVRQGLARLRLRGVRRHRHGGRHHGLRRGGGLRRTCNPLCRNIYLDGRLGQHPARRGGALVRWLLCGGSC